MAERIKVATLSEIPPGRSRQVDAGGRAVALFNVGGTIHAIGGLCTHRGGFLGEGDLDGTVVTCPLHGAEFDVTTGQVVGPPAEQSVPTFKVIVEGEDISVEVPS
jgi:nitrite reductase/ring-hydroxylating ferredoxin subunit